MKGKDQPLLHKLCKTYYIYDIFSNNLLFQQTIPPHKLNNFHDLHIHGIFHRKFSIQTHYLNTGFFQDINIS